MLLRRNITRRARVALGSGAAIAAMVLSAIIGSGAFGASTTSASFSGGAGTATVGGTLYVKTGAVLTLTVTTSSDSECVEVTGDHTATLTSDGKPKSSWTVNFPAASGGGVKSVRVAASPKVNPQGKCTGQSQNPLNASYVLDNTGPHRHRFALAGGKRRRLEPHRREHRVDGGRCWLWRRFRADSGGRCRDRQHRRRREDRDGDRLGWQHRVRLGDRQARQGQA